MCIHVCLEGRLQWCCATLFISGQRDTQLHLCHIPLQSPDVGLWSSRRQSCQFSHERDVMCVMHIHIQSSLMSNRQIGFFASNCEIADKVKNVGVYAQTHTHTHIAWFRQLERQHLKNANLLGLTKESHGERWSDRESVCWCVWVIHTGDSHTLFDH